MEKTRQETQKLRWYIAGALLGPFIAASIYLIITRWPSDNYTGYSDHMGLGFSILVALIFVVKLPISITKRVIALLAYIPVLIIALFFYSVVFLCAFFGACL